METLFEELKRYVSWSAADQAALHAMRPIVVPALVSIADVFYRRILDHEGARHALEGGESQVGRLKLTRSTSNSAVASAASMSASPCPSTTCSAP